MGGKSNSASAIVEQSRSKKRYELRDKIEAGVKAHPYLTFKELARSIGLQYEQYCDAPKRGFDLEKLGRIASGSSRECRVTGRVAQVWHHVDTSTSAVGSSIESASANATKQLKDDNTKVMDQTVEVIDDCKGMSMEDVLSLGSEL